MRHGIRIGGAAFALLAFAHVLPAQPTVYDWNTAGPANWNDAANWDSIFGPFVPSGVTESARINNGGIAEVNSAVPTIAGINVSNGTLDLLADGALETLDDGAGSGTVAIGGNGTLNVSGNGQLSAIANLTNAGTLRLTGPDAAVEVLGEFTNNGTFVANLTGADHSVLNVTGNAQLGGMLQVESTSVTPSFGQSWDIISAGQLTGSFNNVDGSAAGSLDRGLLYRVAQNGGVASLEVGNALIAVVDRQSGVGHIENANGEPIDITSYALRSDRGLLTDSTWSTLAGTTAGAGWRTANPTTNHLAEVSLQDSFSLGVGDRLDLGAPYNGGDSFGTEEDLVFEYTSGGQLVQGFVEYTGAVNDFTLFVDPISGETAIGNLSQFIETPAITSYAILSDTGSLVTENWTSLNESGAAGAGWTEANPQSDHLSELRLQGASDFTTGTLHSLGSIFDTAGSQDLVFQYTTADEQLSIGTVQYGEIPTVGGITGDFNGNGQVEQGDLDLVLLHWGDATPPIPMNWSNDLPEGIIDQAELDKVLLNWGNSAAAGLNAASVPEPGSLYILATMALLIAPFRRGRNVLWTRR